MVPDNMGRVAIVCVLSVFLCVRAVAQEGYLRWSRLSEQIFRVDKWSLCRG